MRPVDRGPSPIGNDGNPIIYTDYKQARGELIRRMGEYCSYCNQKLPASLAVEHVQPKKHVPALRLDWNNFLLGCVNCNSYKGYAPINLNDFVWPDIHNTHLAFKYNDDGTVDISDTITDVDLRRRIQNTLDLVGLQTYNDSREASDRRWKNRRDAIRKARRALELFRIAATKGAENEAAEFVAAWAPDSGFFSVWLDIFDPYPEVKRALIRAFAGTSMVSFDAQFRAIPRTTEL